jgi:hypothetical protein
MDEKARKSGEGQNNHRSELGGQLTVRKVLRLDSFIA